MILKLKFMPHSVDWVHVLLECGENVKVKIQPYLKTSKEPQPDLGFGAGGDKMKLVDLTAEKAIVETLLKHEISFTLVSEESGIKKYGTKPNGHFVTVDPIDGTTNLTRGLPFFCSSIAISHKQTLSDVFAAMVTDLRHDITFTAIKGKGAYRNGEKIATASTTSLEEAVIGIDVNTYKIKEIAPQLTELIQSTKHVRHFGANALELCYVAEGLTDGFVDIRGKIRTTDIAAGFLIIQEAGGIVTTPTNEPIKMKLDPKQKLKFVAAANPTIHKTVLNLIRPQ